MGKDTRLVNIYIKIHNKRNLTIEDLNYLSKYDPECFEKTCKNVVYNVPVAKEIFQPEQGSVLEQPEGEHRQTVQRHMGVRHQPGQGSAMECSEGEHGQAVQHHTGSGYQPAQATDQHAAQFSGMQPEEGKRPKAQEQDVPDAAAQKGQAGKDLPEHGKIAAALSNLKRMEQEGLPIGDVDVDEVKNLLGSLYMELLFPHNDRRRFFNMQDQEHLSTFNKKA